MRLEAREPTSGHRTGQFALTSERPQALRRDPIHVRKIDERGAQMPSKDLVARYS